MDVISSQCAFHVINETIQELDTYLNISKLGMTQLENYHHLKNKNGIIEHLLWSGSDTEHVNSHCNPSL